MDLFHITLLPTDSSNIQDLLVRIDKIPTKDLIVLENGNVTEHIRDVVACCCCCCCLLLMTTMMAATLVAYPCLSFHIQQQQ